MAEAFPEDLQDCQDDTLFDFHDNIISVLFLATKWQFDTYGLSTVNKSLVNNLRVVDPEGKKIKITCAVVETERNIKEDQREDAAKYKIELQGAKRPRGPKTNPNIEWLDLHTTTYYLDLVKENHFDFIIGHVPYLANGALNFRDLSPETEGKPKVILMIHDLPRTNDGETDEEVLLEWLSEVDIIFSVGKEVESEMISSIAALSSEESPIHMLYVPSYPVELFNVGRDKVQGNKVRGTQNVTMMTAEKKNLEISGQDFRLAVTSTAAA